MTVQQRYVSDELSPFVRLDVAPVDTGSVVLFASGFNLYRLAVDKLSLRDMRPSRDLSFIARFPV